MAPLMVPPPNTPTPKTEKHNPRNLNGFKGFSSLSGNGFEPAMTHRG